MTIRFWKMHGAGNDFILVDDRAGTFPAGDAAWLAALAARRTGVGADGIILLQAGADAAVGMRFFNPDGGEADMCGNGARCLARLAHELGAAGPALTLATRAGRLRAEVLPGGTVRVDMPLPGGWRLGERLAVGAEVLTVDSVNTGVPHAVVATERLDDCPVAAWGAALRRHAAFAPAGTNADFVEATGPADCRVRTYERGVEGETLACGTGITAAALVLLRRGRVASPVRVGAAGGDTLTVEVEGTAAAPRRVTLTGPALHVFRGELEYPP